ncbi:MAG: hypothetical protein K2M44_05550 [Clostridia bacterium]|nr:hypothetical protein [Clostridia bacterium]
MRSCVLVIYKRGLMDGAAKAIEQAFDGKSVDVVLADEREIGVISGIKRYIAAVRHAPMLSGRYLAKYYKKYRIKKYKEVSSDDGGKIAFINGIKQALHKSENVLYRFHPSVVVCLTSKSLALMLAARRNTGCGAIICSGIYDFTRSAGLTDKACDKYMVATHAVAASLMRSGMKDGDIYVTGFPVPDKSIDRESARAKLGIEGDLPAVAVIGGRYGNKIISEAAAWLAGYQGKLTAVVITSGNRDAEKAVAALGDSGVIALNGEQNMSDIYAACDIALISPTPFTVAECATNNIPVVLLKPCNRKEKAAFKFLTHGGYCLAGDTQLGALGAVQDLIMDDALYMKRAAAIGEVCSKGMYDGVGKAIETMLAIVGDKDVFGKSVEERDVDGDDAETEQDSKAERADGEADMGDKETSADAADAKDAEAQDKQVSEDKGNKGFRFFRKK